MQVAIRCKKGDSMKLIIGGAYSGKTYFIKDKFKLSDDDFVSGENVSIENVSKYRCIYDFHKFIEKNPDSPEKIELLLNENEDIIVELREVGLGIVPIDAFQRKFREAVGRSGCIIAKRADEVYRMVCGVPMKIK